MAPTRIRIAGAMAEVLSSGVVLGAVGSLNNSRMGVVGLVRFKWLIVRNKRTISKREGRGGMRMAQVGSRVLRLH